jgi:Global regulator protein family
MHINYSSDESQEYKAQLETGVLHFASLERFRERLMLILTRKVGEALKVGEDVTVTVMAVKGN